MMKTLFFIPIYLLILLSPGCSQEQKSNIARNDNYTKNGNFEVNSSDKVTFWKTSGDVQTEATSGIWKRMTTKFRSEKNKTFAFYFYVMRGASGSVWIDNLTISDGITVKNAGFEDFEADGSLTGWRVNNGKDTVFPDPARATEGKKSLRITHEHEAIPETFLMQDIPVEPEKEYTLSFDMFVGEDFQGEAKGWLFNDTHEYSLDFEIDRLLASTLVDDRDRLGKFAVALNAVAGKPISITQDITVPPGANLLASLDLVNKTFKGIVTVAISDIASGKSLYQTNVTTSQQKWSSQAFSFQSASTKARVQITATGEGQLLLDNIAVTPPRVVPSLQNVSWLPATKNFNVPQQLQVFVKGQTGTAIDGGLNLLNKDLKSYGIVAVKTNSATAPVQIFIGRAYKVKNQSDEAYTLTVNDKGVVIKAATEGGAFYGLMTLLQLIDSREGKAVFLPCNVTDYPDMPMRGFLYGDEEQAARWKMNTLMVSTGYPVSPTDRKELHDLVEKCRSLNLDFIPYFLTLYAGYYVQGINPNLAAGIWVQDEAVVLGGEEPSPLANPYVIRTAMTDVRLKSADGNTEYVLGKDYQVIDGEMAYNYANPNAKRFSIARLPGSAIADGSTVLASYDWVSHQRDRNETHIAYVPLEPEAQRLMGEFLSGLTRDFPLTYINTSTDFHEFHGSDAQLSTDSRVIKSGKKPIELLVGDVIQQDAAVKKGNPKARIFQWTGNMGNYAKAGGPHLPRDAHVNIWGYDASWPTAYGREAVEYFSKLGHETSVMSWDNLHNIRLWAQVVAEARKKGYDCKGLIGSCWGPRIGGFKESAMVSWKIPVKGEAGFVALPKAKTAQPVKSNP